MKNYELFQKNEKKNFLSHIGKNIETLLKYFNIFFAIGHLEVSELIELIILIYERIYKYAEGKNRFCVLIPDLFYETYVEYFESEEKDFFYFLNEENEKEKNSYSNQRIVVLKESQLLFKILYDPLLIEFDFILLTHVNKRFEKTDLILALLKKILVKRNNLSIFLLSDFFIYDILIFFNSHTPCNFGQYDELLRRGQAKVEAKKNSFGVNKTLQQLLIEENKNKCNELKEETHEIKHEVTEDREKKKNYSRNEVTEDKGIQKGETKERIKKEKKRDEEKEEKRKIKKEGKKKEEKERNQWSEIYENYEDYEMKKHCKDEKGKEKENKKIKYLSEKNMSIKNKELAHLINEDRCNMTDESCTLSIDYEFEEMERRREKWGKGTKEKEKSESLERKEKGKRKRKKEESHKKRERESYKKRERESYKKRKRESHKKRKRNKKKEMEKRTSDTNSNSGFNVNTSSSSFSSSIDSLSDKFESREKKSRRNTNRKFLHSVRHRALYTGLKESDEDIAENKMAYRTYKENESKRKEFSEADDEDNLGINVKEWKELEEKLKHVNCEINVYVFHLLYYDLNNDTHNKCENNEEIKSNKVYYLKETCTNYINYSIRMIKKMLKEKEKRDNIVLYLNNDYEIEMVNILLKKNEVYNVEIIKNLELYDSYDLRRIKNKIILLKDSFFYKKIKNVKYIIDTCFMQDEMYDPEYLLTRKYTILSNMNKCEERLFISDNCYGFRLITKENFYNSMNESPIPEILKKDLFFYIFYLKTLGIKNICFHEFVTPPSLKCLKRCLEIFYILHLIDINGNWVLEKKYRYFLCYFVLYLPLKFQYSLFLLNSIKYECVYEVCVIIAMLSHEPIFFYDYKNENRLKVFRSSLMAAESDILSYYNIFENFQNAKNKKKYCYIHFLNYKSIKKATSFFCKLKNKLKDFGVPIEEKSKNSQNTEIVKNILQAQTTSFVYNVSKIFHSNKYKLMNQYKNISSPIFSLHPLSILNDLEDDDKKFIVFTDAYVNNESIFILKNASVIDPGWLTNLYPSYFLNKNIHTN